MKQRTIERPSENRLVAVATAIIAVLAALGTLFAHHRSISALSSKNQAILTQARATDSYNAYEARQIRTNIYRALLATDLVHDAQTKARLETAADSENTSTPQLLERARALEKQAEDDDHRAERILRSYETLQFATTAFEISIVLVSIAAIAGTRIFLGVGCGLTTLGLVLFLIGLFAHT